MALTHGLQTGIDGGQGFPHSGRRLDEQVALSGNGSVHIPSQLLLSFPVFRPQVWGFLLVTELFKSQRRLIKTRALDHAAVSLAMSCVRQCRCV